jgi:hypothetical protein
VNLKHIIFLILIIHVLIQITPEYEQYLHEFFAPHNALLTDIIGFNPYDDTEYKGDVSHPIRWNSSLHS